MFVITGGGSGIGRALAQALAMREQQVLIVGRGKKALQETAAQFRWISTLDADITSAKGRQKIIDHLQHTPSLKGLIHCAGVIQPIAPVNQIREEEWHRIILTNLYAPLFLTQDLENQLQQGRVLIMDSNMADNPVKGMSAYCTSRAALKMLFKCWQLDLQPAVTMVLNGAMPGVVDTGMPQQVLDASYIDEPLREQLRKMKAKHLLVPPATTALFLAWLLLDVDRDKFASQAWSIYDSSHHSQWLTPPHRVPV